jgi:hypothetical protein
MHAYKVGELYHPNRTSWDERIEYNYRAQTHEVRVFYKNIRPHERAAIIARPFEIGYKVVGPVIFFLIKFGTDADWSDCPYSWHLVRLHPDLVSEATIPPTLTGNQAALLTIVLVEATNGKIAGLRVVTMPVDFSRGLHDAINVQANTEWSPSIFDLEVKRVHTQLGTRDLVHLADHRARMS